MKKEQFEIIQAVNFLKGMTIRFDQHRKENFIANFLDSNYELLSFFEKAHVLSFALRANQHTKQLTQLFVESNYNVDNDDISSFSALHNNHYKTTKLIIEKGYNPNHEFNGKTIVVNLLEQIHLRASNSNLRKINKVLQTINLDLLSQENFYQISTNIQKAKKNLIVMNKEFPHFTNDIIYEFSLFEQKYSIISRKKQLEKTLRQNAQDFNSKKFKI